MCFFYPNTTLIVSKDRVAKPIKVQWFLCLNLKDCVKQPVAGNRNNSNGMLNNVSSPEIWLQVKIEFTLILYIPY